MGQATLQDFMNMNADTLANTYFGVIELENTKVVGWVEDPMDISQDKHQLRFPLEFKEIPKVVQNNDNQKSVSEIQIVFFRPELGVPDEYITDSAADIYLYKAKSNFGLQYQSALKKMLEGALPLRALPADKIILQQQNQPQQKKP